LVRPRPRSYAGPPPGSFLRAAALGPALAAMKRTAAAAFGAPAASAFVPSGAAMLDPKAYFAQLQAASFAAPQAAAPAAGASAVPGGVVASSGSSEVLDQVQAASAVRCAAIVKEKGQNFTISVSIEALHTMALKSSYKLREDLVKQPHVKRLCLRVVEVLRKPPPMLTMPQLAKAAWCLARFPNDVRGDAQLMLAPVAKMLASSAWESETAVKLLWCMARMEAIAPHKALLSQVVREMVKDKGQRIPELSVEACVDLLFSISRARQHVHKGDHPTVHLEENDEIFFGMVGDRVMKELAKVEVQLCVDLANIHAECGLRREPLFKALCPKIVDQQKDVREDTMSKVIKAYARFMIPLKPEAQGFRTMAIVAKGDFQRPSEKPKRTGKREFDKPQALFAKTQVHQRA